MRSLPQALKLMIHFSARYISARRFSAHRDSDERVPAWFVNYSRVEWTYKIVLTLLTLHVLCAFSTSNVSVKIRSAAVVEKPHDAVYCLEMLRGRLIMLDISCF